MENYLEFSRTRDALSFQLANQAQQYYPFDGHVTPNQLFPQSRMFDDWKGVFFKKIVTFFRTWGETASVFISIWMIWRLLSTLIGWVYNSMVLYNLHGCSRQLFWVPCWKFLLMRNYQNTRLDEYQRRAAESQPDPKNNLNATAGTAFSNVGGCEVSDKSPKSDPPTGSAPGLYTY